jgi:hypothetical protein
MNACHMNSLSVWTSETKSWFFIVWNHMFILFDFQTKGINEFMLILLETTEHVGRSIGFNSFSHIVMLLKTTTNFVIWVYYCFPSKTKASVRIINLAVIIDLTNTRQDFLWTNFELTSCCRPQHSFFLRFHSPWIWRKNKHPQSEKMHVK